MGRRRCRTSMSAQWQTVFAGQSTMFNASTRWASHHDIVDINECLVDNGRCGGHEFVECVNRLSEPPDCVLVDHCANANGGCGDPQFTACENQRDRMPICNDINECESFNGGCGDPASVRCINRIAAEPLCEDVNECANGPAAAGCAENADCINVFGGFICQCRDGFNGDGLAGFGCRDADECAVNDWRLRTTLYQPGAFSAAAWTDNVYSGTDERAPLNPPVPTASVIRWRVTSTVAVRIVQPAKSVPAACKRPIVPSRTRAVRCYAMALDVQKCERQGSCLTRLSLAFDTTVSIKDICQQLEVDNAQSPVFKMNAV